MEVNAMIAQKSPHQFHQVKTSPWLRGLDTPLKSDSTSDVHLPGDVHAYLEHLSPRLEPRTLAGYRQDLLKVFHLNLGNWPADYVHFRLDQGASKRTINLEVQAWHGFIRWQGQEPPPWKPLRHIPQKVRRALCSEEIDRLARASGFRWKIWKAYLLTGARKSELQNLLQEDIDLESRTLTIRDAKRKDRTRAIPIHTDALEIFRRWEDVHALMPVSLSRTFARDAKKAGIRGIDLHCTRVTFITRLIRAGVDLQTVQKLAGHTNIMTTLKYYLKCSHPNDRVAMERLTI